MRSHPVVVLPPSFDDDLGFLQRVEDFAIEQFVTKLRVEAFAIAIFPRTAGHDVGGLGTDSGDPFTQRLGDELRAVVGSNVAGDAALMECTLKDLRVELPAGLWHQLRELKTEPGATERLRQPLASIQDLVDTRPEILNDPAARQHLEDTLLTEIIDLLPTLQPCDDLRSGQARKRLVDHACALMLAQPDQPMSILDVCKGVGTSRRKLNYCFQDVLGSNPIHYLRAVRLNRVRRELKQCSDERTGVYDIAVKWGFWHFSQFSLDYKRHFAELPSEPLRRSRLPR